MRQDVRSSKALVEKHTGTKVIPIHWDIFTKIGEWLDVFVLDRH